MVAAAQTPAQTAAPGDSTPLIVNMHCRYVLTAVTKLAAAIRKIETFVCAVYPHKFHTTVCPSVALTGSNSADRTSSAVRGVVTSGVKMNVRAAIPNSRLSITVSGFPKSGKMASVAGSTVGMPTKCNTKTVGRKVRHARNNTTW